MQTILSRCAPPEANGGARIRARIGFVRAKPRLFQLFRLINQHHWNIVENRIDTLALRTKKSVLCSSRRDRDLAFRANQNLKQFFGNHLSANSNSIKDFRSDQPQRPPMNARLLSFKMLVDPSKRFMEQDAG